MIQQDSTKVTFSQVYNDFKSAVEGAAEALKVGAEHVYEILVRQQVINSITYLFLYVFLFTFSYILFKKIHAYVQLKNKEDKYGEWGAMYILPSIAIVVTMIVFSLTLNTCITGFLNPEYNAIMEIKGFIK